MGFRFWKRIKVAPGVTLNLSKSGPSLSVGPRGAKVTVGASGARASVGIPGTGVFYTKNLTPKRKRPAAAARKGRQTAEPQAAVPAESAVPATEQALIGGCRLLAEGDEAGALARLRQATHLADGACLAGFVALKANALDEAAQHLNSALQRKEELGRHLGKHGLQPEVELAITEEVVAHLGPDERGILLALTEIHQLAGRMPEAMACLQRLRELEPEDVVVRLSLAELLLEQTPGDPDGARQALTLAQGVENDSPVHTALLLHKARALRTLGLPAAAEETLTGALRRKKGRSAELMAALHYERALALEAAGSPEKAGPDLQKAFALAPDYEDVAARLGL